MSIIASDELHISVPSEDQGSSDVDLVLVQHRLLRHDVDRRLQVADSANAWPLQLLCWVKKWFNITLGIFRRIGSVPYCKFI